MKYLAKLLTILLIILFPFGLLIRIKILTNVYITPSDIIVFALSLIVWIVEFKEKSFFKNKFYLLQLLFLLVGFISLLVNKVFHSDINFLVALLYGLRYLCYLTLVKVEQYFNNSKRILPLVYGSALLFVVFGFIQFIAYNDMRKLFYLGWDEHLYRLFSTLFDPNFAGMCLVVIFFLLLQPALSYSFKKGYPFIIINFFVIVAVFITYSRTALVGLFVGIIILGVLNHKIKLLLALTFTSMILLLTVSDTSIEGLNPFRTVSTNERLRSVSEALKIIKTQPMEGVGFNAYRYAQLRFGFRTEAGIALSNSDAGTDNSFLFVTATTGIIGLLFYASSYLYLIRTLLKEKIKSNMYIICIISSTLVGSMFLNILFYTPFLILFFGLIALRKKLRVSE